jgi:acylphosphatase
MSVSTGNVRLHATVEGNVQGVGFRAFVEQVAQQLAVTGWVRNRWDSSVEVLAEGSQTQLEALLEALRRGPRMSYVETVTPEWSQASGEFNRFSVRRTE